MTKTFLKEDLEQIQEYIKSASLSGRTLLITGATGLIGSLIVKGIIEYNLNNQEHIVRTYAMVRKEKKVLETYSDYFKTIEAAEKLGIKFIFQDICEKVKLETQCDFVIHTANATGSQYFMTNPVEVIDSIYTGSKNVLDFARRAKVKGVVYLSSMEVFGKINSDTILHEENLGYIDIQNIRSCYSEGKRMVECMCKCYAEEYGVNVKVARLAQTFGAGVLSTENRVFAQFARSAVKGDDIILHTSGESMGNYCYTTDAIHAIFMLLTEGENGEVYTIVNENMTMEIREMAKLVANLISNGRSKVLFDIPENNVYGYAPETKMRLSGEKIRKLGWKPVVGVQEAYIRMVQDMK